MTANKQGEKPFRREIELDFLRGIAILLVIDFHQGALGLLNYPSRLLGIQHPGWMGVDIFFVLSGFLVGGLLVKEWKVRGRIDTRRFLIRRGFKIWPQYYVYILLMLVAGHRTFHQLLGNLLNIQNYIGGVAHTWSLAVEEHAYLLIVLVLYIAARARVRMRSLFLFFALLALTSSLLRLYTIHLGKDYFDPTHVRIDGILEGVLLAILYHYAPNTFRRLQSRWYVWAGIRAATLVYLRFAIGWWEPSVTIDVANLTGVALLMLLYRHREGHRRPALYRLVAWIGLYSYGIYLWHVSVDAPTFAVARRLPHWAVPLWVGIVPAVSAIALGWLTTKAIEFPFLRLRDRLFPRKVDSAVGTPAELEAPEPAAAEPAAAHTA